MEEEIKKQKEIDTAVLHQKILDKLEAIEMQTKRTNGRVNGLEERMILAEQSLALALKELTGVKTIQLKYKSYAEDAQYELISELKERVKRADIEAKSRQERILWIITTILLFIMGFVGIINADFVKAIL